MMATVDDILGPPHVDDILGPETKSGPLPSYARWPLGLAASAGQGVLAGLGLPGEVERLGTKYIANPLARATGIGHEDDPNTTFFPKSSDMLSLAPALTRWQQGPLAPQGPVERLAQAGASGLGTTVLPALATGGMSIPLALVGTAGGAAGEGAAMLGAPPWVQTAAGVAAGLGIQGATAGLGRSVADVARSLGTSRTLEEAGANFQENLENWRDNIMPQKMANASAEVDALVPPTAPVSGNDTLGNISDLLSRGGASANAVRDFLRDTEKSGGELGRIAKDINGAIVLGTPPKLSWADARAFRTELGQNLRTVRPQMRPALEHLYDGVTSDLGDTAQSLGAGDAFNSFNQISTELHRLDAGPVERILSSEPGDAMAWLLSGARRQGTTLEALRGEVPDAVDELAAAHLNMNPDGKAWGRLAPEARQQLVQDDGDRTVIDAAAPAKGETSTGTKMLEGLVGGHVGGAVTRLGGAALGLPLHPYVTEAAGDILGTAAPWIWSGARGVVRNPLLPLAGGLGATEQPQQ